MSDYDDYVEEVTDILCRWSDFRPLMPEMIKLLWDNGLTILGSIKSPKAFSHKRVNSPDAYSRYNDMRLQMYLSCVDDNDKDVDCTVTWVDGRQWDPRDVTKTHVLHSVEIVG